MPTPHLTDALAACEQSLQPSFRPTEFIMACQKLGNVLQGMGRFEEATRWHTQASLAEPDFVQIYAGMGQVHILQKHWQAAAAAYQKTLHYNPNFAEAYWKLGAIAIYQNQRGRALHYWYRALALEPRKATVDGHLKLGRAFLKLGQVDYAFACYRRAIRLDKSQPLAYQILAQGLVAQGHWEEAIATYRRATEQVKQPGWAYYEWGRLLQQQGSLEEALMVFDQAVEHDPEYPWTHHDGVQLLLAQQRWEEAIARSRAAIAQGDFPWAYSQLGRALIAQGNREGAIAAHQTACDRRGWSACKTNDYQFTQDWFSHNIPIWETYLRDLIGAANVWAAEVGSFQGMSACWLLDRVLTHPTARLICIDPNVQPEFDPNLAKTGAAEKVTRHAGNSHRILPTLPTQRFDLIYIDGCHLAHHVQQDGHLAWPLLKPGGFLIFDDYWWTDPNAPGQDPKLGIDRFLATVQAQAEILHHDYQVIVKKVASVSSG